MDNHEFNSPGTQQTTVKENSDTSKTGKSTPKFNATWDPKSHKIFIKLCIDEVRAGNRPNSHFSRLGWNNIQRKFVEETGKNYNRLQLKNHWDAMKKDWVMWQSLIGKETGLGWDVRKNTIDASDEWWNDKIQRNPKCAKFREKGLEHRYELDELFMDIAATGARAWTPNSGEMPSIFSPDKAIELDSSDDDTSEILGFNNTAANNEVENEEGHKSKRSTFGKSSQEKRKKITTGNKLEKHLERLVEAVEVKSRAPSTTAVPKTEEKSIQECMDLLDEIPDIIRLDSIFMFATQLFLKSEYRAMFIALRDPEARVAWLKHEQEREYNSSRAY